MNWKKTVFAAALILATSFSLLSEDKKVKKEKHKVQVSAGIVPVYVTDGNGKPVLNLKKGDFKLLINGRQIPFQFINHSITEKELKAKKSRKKVVRKVKPSKKVHVLILDTIFNSRNGMYKSKELMKKMIVADKGRHSFLIIQIGLVKGVKTYSPITKSIKVLNKSIDKITPKPSLTRGAQFSSRMLRKDASIPLWDPRDQDATNGGNGNMPYTQMRKSEAQFYRHSVLQYETFFEKLKYLLATIKEPKICFLFSEGIAQGAMLNADIDPTADPMQGQKYQSILDYTFTETNSSAGLYSRRYIQILKNIAKNINNAGTLMYSINPQSGKVPDTLNSGAMTLSSITTMSGGKYFAGSDPVTVFEEITRSTSAYYELAYNSQVFKKRNNSVKVICKRPDTQLNTIKFTQASTSYQQLNNLEKRLFIVDMLVNGDYAGFELLKDPEAVIKDKGSKKHVTITVPAILMKNKMDIYRVTFKKDRGVEMLTESKTPGKYLEYDLKGKDISHFIVFIDYTDRKCAIVPIKPRK